MPYQSPFNLPDEHMRLVGIIASHWECLDVALQRTLAAIAEHEHSRIALFTENIPFRAKMDLIMAYARVFQERRPGVWGDFTKAEAAVRAAYGIRNSYIHARWKLGASPDLPMRVVVNSRGGKFTIEDVPTSVQDAEAAAHAIYQAGEGWTTFFQELGMLKS